MAKGDNFKLTQNEVIKQFKEKHGDRYIYDKVEYVNAKTKVWIGCKVEGHGYFEQTPDRHKRGAGCQKCSGHKVSNTNSIMSKFPELMIYLKNKSDGYKYSYGSTKCIELICPKCGDIRTDMRISTFTSQGFSCNSCNDGVSIPEKFVSNLFKQLNINFKPQKVFNWAKDKKYDFYIIDREIIIEVHGIQHYENSTRGRSLQEEQKNDKLKYDLAIENGIKPDNYIIIDCRYSTFEWVKENCIKSLNNYLDITNINWDNVWWKAISVSNVVESIKLWNEGLEIKDISNILKIDVCTVRRYLNKGTEQGKCLYDGKFNNIKNRRKRVVKYDLDFNKIKTYESIANACEETGIGTGISECCRGRLKTSGGYIWRFEEYDIYA